MSGSGKAEGAKPPKTEVWDRKQLYKISRADSAYISKSVDSCKRLYAYIHSCG